MTKWEYRKLVCWHLRLTNLSGGPIIRGVAKDDRGWYWDTDGYWRDGDLGQSLKSKLYAGGSTPTRLPLNPAQDWQNVPPTEQVTWAEDEGYADVAMDVMNKMGTEGWELVLGDGMDYIFKRPVER